ncbi:MAG: TolC family protein [Putridiphycobacter sp.]
MKKNNLSRNISIVVFTLLLTACAIPALNQKKGNLVEPDTYANGSTDTLNIGQKSWKIFFKDPYLVSLIDTALVRNQELNIILQEIAMSSNVVEGKKGAYLPSLRIGTTDGVEKVGRYTSQGANDANTQIEPGKDMPDPLQNYQIGGFASWEIDVWRKLRNIRDAAINRYLGSIEGKNFVVTTLVAEVANSYYELLALDKKLAIIKEYITIQENALAIVKLQKQAGEATELAVKKFEAEVLDSKSRQFDILQKIVETENHINFLLGRYPQPILRDSNTFEADLPETLSAGIPSQLLENRPDIKQAEYELAATKLDVKVAKAEFYPSIRITAGVGFEAFNPAYFIKSPESLIYNLAGDLTAPLLNRKAIKAAYLNANAKQIQAIYDFESKVLNGFVEVANSVSKIDNLNKSYGLKKQQVAALNRSIVVANGLFKSAKIEYLEVLITQRDALDGRMELIEYKKNQFNTMINLYRALGGGWK